MSQPWSPPPSGYTYHATEHRGILGTTVYLASFCYGPTIVGGLTVAHSRKAFDRKVERRLKRLNDQKGK